MARILDEVAEDSADRHQPDKHHDHEADGICDHGTRKIAHTCKLPAQGEHLGHLDPLQRSNRRAQHRRKGLHLSQVLGKGGPVPMRPEDPHDKDQGQDAVRQAQEDIEVSEAPGDPQTIPAKAHINQLRLEPLLRCPPYAGGEKVRGREEPDGACRQAREGMRVSARPHHVVARQASELTEAAPAASELAEALPLEIYRHSHNWVQEHMQTRLRQAFNEHSQRSLKDNGCRQRVSIEVAHPHVYTPLPVH
mmetsp:Transcript_46570/g.129628  ORF Transcript_46570/g.129628 Transcript_46570/m.129628 type:complete len:250 (-) Transcript_46570:1077-1826(-)